MGWFIAILITVIGLILFIAAMWKDTDTAGMTLAGTILLIIGIAAILSVSGLSEANREPRPIDVYRGHTTLKITYQDSIPLDTVVVWKEEFKPGKKK